MNYKNNNPMNYNHMFVYLFTRDGYKVRITMTAQRDVGSAINKIQREYRNVNDRRVIGILN